MLFLLLNQQYQVLKSNASMLTATAIAASCFVPVSVCVAYAAVDILLLPHITSTNVDRYQ